jgi:drug/metabolite transporter (DMT)-like permease
LPGKTEEQILQSATSHAHPWRGYLYIAVATLCWGASAAVGKIVFNGGLFAGQPAISPLVLTQARTTFSLAMLALFLFLRGGRSAFRIGARDLGSCLLVGSFGLGVSAFFYYVAIQQATVAIAITVQYTAPVWVLLYMVLRGREKLTARRVSAVVLALTGVALTIGLFQSGGRLNAYGAGAAMVAAFGFSFYNIGAQALITRHHQFKVMLYALLGSSLLWLTADPPWRLFEQHYSTGQWAFLFLFACGSMLVPFAFYFTGLKYLDPTRAVVTSCLEPVFAVLMAGVFAHETVRSLQVAGIVAVLAATVMVQIQDRRGSIPPSPKTA